MARSRTYPREVRERAVALVFGQVKSGQYGSRWEAICSVAAKVGATGETVRKWVRQAEVDAGIRPARPVRSRPSSSGCAGKIMSCVGRMRS
jgi:transposase